MRVLVVLLACCASSFAPNRQRARSFAPNQQRSCIAPTHQSTSHERHRPRASAADDEESDGLWWEPAENDIVEYETGDGDALGVGVVLNSGEIHPLCVFEDGGTTFVWDEEVSSVPGDSAVRVVDDVYPTTRQAQRGVDNPHGEHAEDVFLIEAGVLDDRVVVAVRPERDIVW